MWQGIAVWIIVGAVLVLVARGLYRTFKGKAPACHCGCAAECPMAREGGAENPSCLGKDEVSNDKPNPASITGIAGEG
jgi:hypothetical protein